MAEREIEEIRKSFMPIYISTWVFGVPRVSYTFSFRLIYSTVLLATFLATFSATFDTRTSLVGSFNTGMAIPYIATQLITFVANTGTIIFWVSKGARALEDAIIKLAEVDVLLKDLGMNINQRYIVSRQIILIILFSCIWLITVVLNDYILFLMGVNDKISIMKAVYLGYSSHGPNLIILFCEIVFSTIMYAFYMRFQWINQTLKSASEDHVVFNIGKMFRILPARIGQDSPTLKENTSTEGLLLNIKRLYKAHERLCEISEKISSSFSWELYFTVSAAFILLVYRLLVTYSFILIPNSQPGVKIGLNVVWICYYILKFWMITLTCYHTSAEANKLAIMLHRIEINDEKYYRMLDEYSIQLCLNKLHFTVGGFFPIDLSLVNSLISHLTTYIFFAVDAWSAGITKTAKIATIQNVPPSG